MTPADLVRSAYEAFGRGDLAAVLAVVAADAEWRCSSNVPAPFTGTRTGPAGAADFFAALAASVRLTSVVPERFLADGDTVVVVGRDSGAWIDGGAPYAAEWVHVWTVRGAQVVRWHEFVDVRS